jgi:tRNA nucleotidyltransferase/poly(A) polymerase
MMKLFMVGGIVRDGVLGRNNKDLDIMATATWTDVLAFCEANDFRVVDEFTKHLTAKVIVPRDHPWRRFTPNGAVDIACSRVDGPRRTDAAVFEPDPVKDLARRDFTINAMAREIDLDGNVGELLDPFGGRDDLAFKRLRFVGDPWERIDEDPSRIVRGLRFMITLGLTPGTVTWMAILDEDSAAKLKDRVPAEVIRDEMIKMLSADLIETMRWLTVIPPHLQDAVFKGGAIKLQPTLASRLKAN